MRLLAAVGLTLAAGCAAGPETAQVRWSDAEPVVSPRLPADERDGGWLSVRTKQVPGYSSAKNRPAPPAYRRYAVFDADGSLVYACHGHSTERDVIPLPRGRYIVVAVVDRGMFDRTQETVQILIEKDQTTLVDVTSSAEHRDGTP